MKLIILFSFLVFVGCSRKEPLEIDKTNNSEINVEYLFTHKGCEVSRFFDNGRSIYFSSCSQSFEYAKKETCGKNCIKTRKIQTLGL